MNCFCKEHGAYDSPKNGCPDCKKEEIRHIQGIVDNWGHSCPECIDKDHLMDEMARVLEYSIKAVDCCATYYQNSLWTAKHKMQEALQKYRERK